MVVVLFLRIKLFHIYAFEKVYLLNKYSNAEKKFSPLEDMRKHIIIQILIAVCKQNPVTR